MSAFAYLFSFKGRIRRSDFWLCSTIVFAMMITTAATVAWAMGVDIASTTDIRAAYIQAGSIALFMWPNLAVCAKRLHDRDQSGWWVLLSYLPVIGNAWMVINLGIGRGTEGDNRYGEDPIRPQLTLIQRDHAVA